MSSSFEPLTSSTADPAGGMYKQLVWQSVAVVMLHHVWMAVLQPALHCIPTYALHSYICIASLYRHCIPEYALHPCP